MGNQISVSADSLKKIKQVLSTYGKDVESATKDYLLHSQDCLTRCQTVMADTQQKREKLEEDRLLLEEHISQLVDRMRENQTDMIRLTEERQAHLQKIAGLTNQCETLSRQAAQLEQQAAQTGNEEYRRQAAKLRQQIAALRQTKQQLEQKCTLCSRQIFAKTAENQQARVGVLAGQRTVQDCVGRIKKYQLLETQQALQFEKVKQCMADYELVIGQLREKTGSFADTEKRQLEKLLRLIEEYMEAE